jgi:hypothetical protein
VVFPGALAVVIVVLQGAMYWHARQVALSAVQQGVAAAAVAGIDTGQRRAQQVADDLGGIDGPTVAAVSSGEAVTVTVVGRAPSLLPGVTMTVRASATAPAERFRGP